MSDSLTQSVISQSIDCLITIRGECNSCVLTVGGTRMKPCVDKVPPEPRLKSLQENGLAIK